MSIAASFGIAGASVSVAAAAATNAIDNRVEAYLKGAHDLKTTLGAVSVGASETSTINSRTAAASTALSASALGGAASAATTTASNTLTSTVAASIQSSAGVSSAAGVSVTASDTSTISAEIAAASLAAGVNSLAVGVALVDNSIGNTVSAFTSGSTITAGGSGEIRVTASSTPTITSTSTVGAVSFGFGGAGAGGSSKTTITGTTQAYVDGGALTALGNDVVVSADATSLAAPVIQGLSAGLSAVTVMSSEASVGGQTLAWAGGTTTVAAGSFDGSTINITRTTSAKVATGADLSIGAGQLALTAHSTTLGTSIASSAAIAAVQLTTLSVTTDLANTTLAAIESGATVRAADGTVAVSAIADNQAESKVRSVGVGIGLSAGSSLPTARITSTTQAASLGNIIGTSAATMASDVNVSAIASDRATAGSESAGGGLVSIGSSHVLASTAPTVRADAGGTIQRHDDRRGRHADRSRQFAYGERHARRAGADLCRW